MPDDDFCCPAIAQGVWTMAGIPAGRTPGSEHDEKCAETTVAQRDANRRAVRATADVLARLFRQQRLPAAEAHGRGR